MFQLQVLLLAKMQWEVRQCPEEAVSDTALKPWPRQLIKPGVLSSMLSPCVAGDLLRQRAPGLVPHSYQVRAVPGGRRRQGGTLSFLTIGPHQLTGFVGAMAHSFKACMLDQRKFAALGECCYLAAGCQ
jgi:hypothetical protein